MKKSIILLSVFSFLFLVSCMSSSFVYTGDHKEPLPKNNNVKVVMDDKDKLSYDEVGIIEVKESIGSVDFSDIVSNACEIARNRGADCIIFINRSSSVSGTADAISTTNQYLFKAVRLKENY